MISSQSTLDEENRDQHASYLSKQCVNQLGDLEKSQRVMLTFFTNQTHMLERIISRLGDVTDCVRLKNNSILIGGCAGKPRNGDVHVSAAYPSGVYSVQLPGTENPIDVFCDMRTDRGGWTVFQRRRDGSVNFLRPWHDYETGFGYKDGEFWLGNEYLHTITRLQQMKLRIDLTDWSGNSYFAEYSNFVVGESRLKYKLVSVGEYSGNAGDSLTYHVGLPFSTIDQDNDIKNGSCSQQFKGAWWYKYCHLANLNGEYKIGGVHETLADGIEWHTLKGYFYSFKTVEMKVRPVDY